MRKQQKWSGVKVKKTEDTLSKAEIVEFFATIIGLFIIGVLITFGIIVAIVALEKMILGV